MKIGVDERYINEGVSKSLSTAILQAIDDLKKLGAIVVNLKIPVYAAQNNAWLTVTCRDAYDA